MNKCTASNGRFGASGVDSAANSVVERSVSKKKVHLENVV